MAHLQKLKRRSGTAYRLHFYLNNKRRSLYFPPGTPKSVVEAERKRIESEVALHKAGIKQMQLKKKPVKLTLEEFTRMVLKGREKDVAKRTLRRNFHALNASWGL